MPIPGRVTSFNKKFANPIMRRFSGLGPMAEIEHVGRRSGQVRWTPIFAFRRGSSVTVALTYGTEVDWLKNLELADSTRLRQGRRILRLGHPVPLSSAEGMRRMPPIVRWGLRRMGVTDFIEMPILWNGPARVEESQ